MALMAAGLPAAILLPGNGHADESKVNGVASSHAQSA
jgi:hypothetical protein